METQNSIFGHAVLNRETFCNPLHYLKILFENPENTWFTPNNKKDEAFTICEQLAAYHIIAKKTIPIYKNGCFTGNQHQFFYNKNLDYSAITK